MKMAASLPMRPFYLTRLSSHTAWKGGAACFAVTPPSKQSTLRTAESCADVEISSTGLTIFSGKIRHADEASER
jgi:hypothetical protein